MTPLVEQDKLAQRTIDLMGLADVPRWSVVKTMRSQSVAEHSFLVAVFTMELISRLSTFDMASPVSLGAVLWAICHDAPETYTGDIDGLLKREWPGIKTILEQAEGAAFPWYAEMKDGMFPALIALVKVADHIESIVFLRQWGIGSRADDVGRELTTILTCTDIPALVDALRGGKGSGSAVNAMMVEATVMEVLDHSTLETGSYQFRRRLKLAGTDQSKDGGTDGTDTGS